jgi:zinc and cadmium transporter
LRLAQNLCEFLIGLLGAKFKTWPKGLQESGEWRRSEFATGAVKTYRSTLKTKTFTPGSVMITVRMMLPVLLAILFASTVLPESGAGAEQTLNVGLNGPFAVAVPQSAEASAAVPENSGLTQDTRPLEQSGPVEGSQKSANSEAEEFLDEQIKRSAAAVGQGESGWLLVAYCTAIVIASIGGGWLPSLVSLTHTRMQTVISFVGGLMLGIAVFHLFPHSIHGSQSADDSAWWMMAGIITMFLLIRCFHFHHHGPLEISTAEEDPCASHRGHAHDHSHDHGRHDHDHSHAHDHDDAQKSPLKILSATQIPSSQTSPQPHCHHAHQLSWLGITLGLSLHTLIDGMALAASVQAESTFRNVTLVSGLGTFLAIMLHKPLDAVSITSLMAGAGWSTRSRLLVSVIFSTMCPIGALLFRFGISLFGEYQDEFVSSSLAFSAGVFLCISLSDLLPEMEFHAHNRVRLTAALLAGILLAYGITFLEPGHLH